MNTFKEGQKETNPATDSQAQAAIGKGRKVLVVDDDPVVLKAFEFKLKGLGFEVITTKEYTEAASMAQKQKPDLIVLDVNFEITDINAGLQWDGFNLTQWMQ